MPTTTCHKWKTSTRNTSRRFCVVVPNTAMWCHWWSVQASNISSSQLLLLN